MSERQIVDWHIHCYLPEHRSAEDREITARRNVRRESGDPDPARFREVVERELLSLHDGNFSRYRVRPSEFAGWQMVWRG